MINTKVVQTMQAPLKLAVYEIRAKESIIATAQVEPDGYYQKIFYKEEQKEYFLKYKREQGILICRIQDKEKKEVGLFTKAGCKKGFFDLGFAYIHATLFGIEYNLYEVDLGKKGVYFPCYVRKEINDGEQVGLIHKPSVVIDFKDEYLCYAKNKNCLQLLHFFSLYTDVLKYRNSGKGAKYTKEYQYSYSFHRALKNKYNPKFLADEFQN